MDGMTRYTVIYDELPDVPGWQFFLCWADDVEHAEAQCMDANPAAKILWVNEGENFTMEEPRQLDDFTRGYIECALWAEHANHPDDPDSDASFESAGYSMDDLAPDALELMVSDCRDFQVANCDDLESVYMSDLPYSPVYAGHDFWLTRNGHGAGFWDRGLGALGDRLTAASKAYGSADLYLGDDGLIYHY